MSPRTHDGEDKRVFTSSSRHRGEYRCDVAIYETRPPADAGRFYAQVVNMVRLEGGQSVSINADLPDRYGASPEEAYSALEADVEAWVKAKTPSA